MKCAGFFVAKFEESEKSLNPEKRASLPRLLQFDGIGQHVLKDRSPGVVKGLG